MKIKLLLRGVLIGGFASVLALQAYAGSDDSSGQRPHGWMEQRTALFEAHLEGLKAVLKLSGDQEKNWPAFEGAVRTIDEQRREQFREGKERTPANEVSSPIDRLQAISEKLERRSSEMKALAAAASPLYASLNDSQRQDFALLFSEIFRKRGHGRHRS
jgi:zinc resistance-associated protein